MERKSFDIGSVNVAYWVDITAGPDKSWLVFLPGLTADHTPFEAQMTYFSNRFNCVVWDAPAHGESRPYPLGFTMDDLARILHGVLESEGIERPVLIGQSLGAYIVQAYLDLHPYRMLADAIEAERPYDIDCPALLLCGGRDRAGDVKPYNCKWAAGERIPLVWVPSAGHNSNVDAPDFVNAQIDAFVAGLEV